jgi:dipeptidase
VRDLPHAYQIGDPQKFSRKAAWWAFDFVANWARLNYQRMCKVDIQPLQAGLEAEQQRLLREWDQQCANPEELTRRCAENADYVLKHWWELADRLIAKYSDGYINLSPAKPQNPAPVPIGYSAAGLGVTNYREGPVSYDMKL